jgi:hypothetical protein
LWGFTMWLGIFVSRSDWNRFLSETIYAREKTTFRETY